jgi:hypothetical protein
MDKRAGQTRSPVMAIPRQVEPVQRTIEHDLGLDLFG